VQENVLSFDVSVDLPQRVEVREALNYLREDARQQPFVFNTLVAILEAHYAVDAAAFEKGHDQPELFIGNEAAVVVENVLVVVVRHDGDFLAYIVNIAVAVEVDHLDGDSLLMVLTVGLEAVRAPDNAEAAMANRPVELVVVRRERPRLLFV